MYFILYNENVRLDFLSFIGGKLEKREKRSVIGTIHEIKKKKSKGE